MRRVVLQATLVLLMVFVAIQLVRPPRTNPPGDPSRTLQTHLATHPAAPVIARACGDCHSHETTWPWYSQIAPVSWVVAHDVNDARRAVNFSDWSSYPAEQQKKLLRESCEEVRTREMPLALYMWLHPEARLGADDIRAICDLAQSD